MGTSNAMGILELIDAVTAFLHANPIAAAIIGLFLIFLMIRKTKLFFGLLLLVLLLLGVLLMIQLIGGEGSSKKSRMIKQDNLQEPQ
jgi:hypothetical protein